MPDHIDPVRIRITARQSGGSNDPREDFWSPLRRTQEFGETSTYRLEAKLQREFGPALRGALLEQLSAAFRAIDSGAFPDTFRDFERLWFEFLGPMREREWMRYQWADAFTRLIEHRLQVLRETPAIRDAQGRIAAAAGVVFSARIAGYSSLDLDLSIGSMEKLVDVFDGHFDSFRVFLEAFVPNAFAEVFTEEFADGFDYSIRVPASMSTAFERSATAGKRAPRESAPATGRPDSAPKSDARERAEWLWKLANGSLLVPVVLALLVMFYGLRAISEIYRDHRNALAPVVEHQLELLKEDRERLSQGSGRAPASRSDTDTAIPAPTSAEHNGVSDK